MRITRTGVPGIGRGLDNHDEWAMMRLGGAVPVGTVCAYDHAQTETETTGIDEDDEASVMTNVRIASEANAKQYGSLGIKVRTAGVDNSKGQIRRWGRCKALVVKASGSVAVGDPLTVEATVTNVATSVLDGVLVSGDRIVARALEAATTPTSATLIEVEFDGELGFGKVT